MSAAKKRIAMTVVTLAIAGCAAAPTCEQRVGYWVKVTIDGEPRIAWMTKCAPPVFDAPRRKVLP